MASRTALARFELYAPSPEACALAIGNRDTLPSRPAPAKRARRTAATSLSSECRLLDRCVGGIEADDVKDRFADVDAKYGCISWLVAYAHNYLLLNPPNVRGRTGRVIPLTLLASEADRPDVAEARRTWRTGRQPRMAQEPHRLVFVDETGTTTKMTRLRGRARRGGRGKASAPFGHWCTQTFRAGMRCDGLTASWLIGRPLSRQICQPWIETQLAPTLRPGDVVILDNLSSHKSEKAKAILKERGAWLLFLPPYSP